MKDTHPGARWALVVLLVINLVNYLDRQVLYAVLPLIKDELGATDAELGALAMAFMLVYMCAAPVISYLADRTSRRMWIAGGVLFWSGATVISGLSQTYRQLFLSRAAVGIGESCYGSLSPSLLAEHYPKERRAAVLSLFSMAIPVGSALGYILGGAIGDAWGWRTAFYVAGVPGIILAFLALYLKDPRAADSVKERAPTAKEYAALAHNKSFVLCTAAMAAMTFGLGAFAVWMPSFFVRTWGLKVSEAGTVFGAVTVAAGLVGSLLGGWLSDRLMPKTTKAYLIVSGAGLIAAFPFGLLTIAAGSYPLAVAALFFAELGAFLNMGPLNALIVSVTGVRMRSMAFAANIFFIHALGDAISPAIIGYLSDLFGLRAALSFATGFLALAGLICLAGMPHLDEDVERASSPRELKYA